MDPAVITNTATHLDLDGIIENMATIRRRRKTCVGRFRGSYFRRIEQP